MIKIEQQLMHPETAQSDSENLVRSYRALVILAMARVDQEGKRNMHEGLDLVLKDWRTNFLIALSNFAVKRRKNGHFEFIGCSDSGLLIDIVQLAPDGKALRNIVMDLPRTSAAITYESVCKKPLQESKTVEQLSDAIARGQRISYNEYLIAIQSLGSSNTTEFDGFGTTRENKN